MGRFAVGDTRTLGVSATHPHHAVDLHLGAYDLTRLLEDASNQPTVRAISWAQTGGTGCGDATSLSADPRAQGMRQAKGLRLQLPAPSSQLFMTFKASLGCGL